MALPPMLHTLRALAHLEHAAIVIGRVAGEPELTGPPGQQWYRYPTEELAQIIAVKSARAVSALHATFVLIQAGFSVEISVLLRTVDDFLDEIGFLLEGHDSSTPTVAQTKFAELFFAETILPVEEMQERPDRADRVKRKSIRAAQGRLLQPDNPDEVQKMASAIDHTFDGYVHGGYPHSMELYHPDLRRFMLRGTYPSRYLEAAQKHHAIYIVRALNYLVVVLRKCDETELAERLLAFRKEYESGPDYPADGPADAA
jgi:hypothetical protein